jgi:AraC family transcriptional activator of pobA
VPDGELHALDFVEVLLVDDGDGALHTAGNHLRVRGPSIVVTRPDVSRVPANPALGRLTAIGESIEPELLAPQGDSTLMLDALLSQFLVILGRTSDLDQSARKPRLVARFEELLERWFRDEHHVRAYASALGVSADHLSDVVRGWDGGNAKAMVDERIMREARRLLATDLRIADIAERLGYDEPSHFTRAFRRSSGMSPECFRFRQ